MLRNWRASASSSAVSRATNAFCSSGGRSAAAMKSASNRRHDSGVRSWVNVVACDTGNARESLSCGAIRHDVTQPGFRGALIAADRRGGDAQQAGDLLQVETGEVAQFDHLRLSG